MMTTLRIVRIRLASRMATRALERARRLADYYCAADRPRDEMRWAAVATALEYGDWGAALELARAGR